MTNLHKSYVAGLFKCTIPGLNHPAVDFKSSLCIHVLSDSRCHVNIHSARNRQHCFCKVSMQNTNDVQLTSPHLGSAFIFDQVQC